MFDLSRVGRGGLPRVAWFLAFLAILVRVIVLGMTGFTNEDAYITLRYAVHIAQGHGFVYNLGERTLGTTTPLYTLLLALFSRLGLPALDCGKALNILADGALCLLMFRWVQALDPRSGTDRPGDGRPDRSGQDCLDPRSEEDRPWGPVILAALLVALNPVHIRWSISGMETSLVTLCGVWIWICYAERRYAAAYLTLGLLFLLRWDSALMAAVLTAATVWRERKLPWRELLLYAALILPWLLFATRYFGSPIPVTAASKMTVYGWRADHDPVWLLRALPQSVKLFRLFVWSPGGAFLTAAACFALWRGERERWTALRPALVWFLLYWVAFLLSRVLLFPWYVAPPLPVYELLAAFGLASLGRTLAVRWPPLARRGLRWGAIVALSVVATVGMVLSCGETQRTEGSQNREIGLWLKARARPTDRVMLEPIGYIGYYSGLPVVDVVGLVTPETLFAYAPTTRAPMREIALRFRPAWCVLRPGEIEHILSEDQRAGARWSELYREAQVFSMPRPGQDPIVFTVFERRDLATTE